jgi:putative oxidoreductase
MEPVRRPLMILLRIALGAIFLYAAYTKLREPWMIFAIAIDAYGILPEPAVLATARTLPWCELVLGAILLTGFGLRYAALAATVLLGAFFTVMLIAYRKGLAIDCACFGPGDIISLKTLARDGTLVAAAIALAVLSRVPHPPTPSRSNRPTSPPATPRATRPA